MELTFNFKPFLMTSNDANRLLIPSKETKESISKTFWFPLCNCLHCY